jgi:hypothetical protein
MKIEPHRYAPLLSGPSHRTAPSLRVPVTAGNRAFLRWLRAAEMSAWEAGRPWRDEAQRNAEGTAHIRDFQQPPVQPNL